ncbi:ribonuclease P [Candidatus Mycoplasma haematolamae str. Purdue]|uniref:Ribonuclease P protein component n=1 Tax=Mycoplasma haematolamae (strain Purdue) TaxID=1212765 RepID=I7CKX2_MYCHA|nr:ribonuclease P protein component [Candidatus Mycoplasma haematolamae]AFO52504.1 ribonuclease P [Candidatus Mycoplasma haematolamae str. Purdue]
MKKKFRLLKKSEFEAVFKGKERIKTPNLIFYYLPTSVGRQVTENIKIGVIVPKKKWKRAVVRNYLKRVIWSLHSRYSLEGFPKTLAIILFSNFFHENYRGGKVNYEELQREIEKIYSVFLRRCS